MITTAIMAILAAMLIPTLNHAKNKSKVESEIKDLKTDITISSELIKRVIEIKEKQKLDTAAALIIALKETPTEATPAAAPPQPDSKNPADPKLPEMDTGTPPAKTAEEVKKAELEVPAPTPPIKGVIIYKAEIKYGESSDKPVTEYWFYVRKFDLSKTDPTFDSNPPVWLEVESSIFLEKEVGRTYNSQQIATADMANLKP